MSRQHIFADPAQLAELVKLYGAGKSMIALSRIYGCTPRTVRSALAHAGAAVRTAKAQLRLDAGNIRDALTARVVIDPDTGCWMWRGFLMHGKYPVLGYAGKQHFARRLAYIEYIGKPPAPGDLGVTCGHSACIKPQHAIARTRSESITASPHTRRGARNNAPRGAAHPWSKLSDDDVRTIRTSTEPRATVARRYGISINYVSAIRWSRARVSFTTAQLMQARDDQMHEHRAPQEVVE